MVYVHFAEGFEEVEAVTIVDLASPGRDGCEDGFYYGR